MRAAEPVIREQAAYLLIAGNQPRLIARHGADPVDHAILQQLAEQRRYLQRMSLLKRAAEPSCLTPPQHGTARARIPPSAATRSH